MRTFSCLFLIFLLESCGCHVLTRSSTKNVFGNLTFFHYYFQDAPVSPAYHRSYSIHIDTDKVQVWVYGSGDTLTNQVYASPDSALHHIGQALLVNGIRQHKRKKSLKSCAGGIGHRIIYGSHVDTTFSAGRYVCGGDYGGNLKGNIDQLLQDIAFLTPQLDSLIETTR